MRQRQPLAAPRCDTTGGSPVLEYRDRTVVLADAARPVVEIAVTAREVFVDLSGDVRGELAARRGAARDDDDDDVRVLDVGEGREEPEPGAHSDAGARLSGDVLVGVVGAL